MSDLEAGKTARLFKEAIELRMVPCDFRVWRDYYFIALESSADAKKLVNLYWELLHTHNIDAQVIAMWCKNGTFLRNASQTLLQNACERVKGESLNFLKSRKGEDPFDRRLYLNAPRLEATPAHKQKFREQAVDCFTFNEARQDMDSASLPRRYDYLVYCLLVWKFKHEPNAALSLADASFWFYLGSDISTAPTSVYGVTFSTRPGIVKMEFHDFGACDRARDYALEYLSRHIDYNKLEDFFNKTRSVWHLEQLLQSGMKYESISKNDRFKNVADAYGYSYLEAQTQDVKQFEQWALHLSQIYIRVLGKGHPIRLQTACEQRKVLEYVQEVCTAEISELPQQVVNALKKAGKEAN